MRIEAQTFAIAQLQPPQVGETARHLLHHDAVVEAEPTRHVVHARDRAARRPQGFRRPRGKAFEATVAVRRNAREKNAARTRRLRRRDGRRRVRQHRPCIRRDDARRTSGRRIAQPPPRGDALDEPAVQGRTERAQRKRLCAAKIRAVPQGLRTRPAQDTQQARHGIAEDLRLGVAFAVEPPRQLHGRVVVRMLDARRGDIAAAEVRAAVGPFHVLAVEEVFVKGMRQQVVAARGGRREREEARPTGGNRAVSKGAFGILAHKRRRVRARQLVGERRIRRTVRKRRDEVREPLAVERHGVRVVEDDDLAPRRAHERVQRPPRTVRARRTRHQPHLRADAENFGRAVSRAVVAHQHLVRKRTFLRGEGIERPHKKRRVIPTPHKNGNQSDLVCLVHRMHNFGHSVSKIKTVTRLISHFSALSPARMARSPSAFKNRSGQPPYFLCSPYT